jgi:hypothetical protein
VHTSAAFHRQQTADARDPGPRPARQADLTDLSSLPATLVGVSAIIDCATARPEESTQKVDWEGKIALIQCAQAMGISRYIFFSIFNCDKHPEVPLMNIKACTEEFLAGSGLNYTTLRLCGFMQVRPRLHGAANGRGAEPQPGAAAATHAPEPATQWRALNGQLPHGTGFWAHTRRPRPRPAPSLSGRDRQLCGADPGGPPGVGHQRRDAHCLPGHPGMLGLGAGGLAAGVRGEGAATLVPAGGTGSGDRLSGDGLSGDGLSGDGLSGDGLSGDGLSGDGLRFTHLESTSRVPARRAGIRGVRPTHRATSATPPPLGRRAHDDGGAAQRGVQRAHADARGAAGVHH